MYVLMYVCSNKYVNFKNKNYLISKRCSKKVCNNLHYNLVLALPEPCAAVLLIINVFMNKIGPNVSSYLFSRTTKMVSKN